MCPLAWLHNMKLMVSATQGRCCSDTAIWSLLDPIVILVAAEKGDHYHWNDKPPRGVRGKVKEEGYKEYSLQCLLQAGLIVAHANQNQMSQHHCLYKQACLCSVVPRLSCVTCKMTSNPGYRHLDLVLIVSSSERG